ncbi:hypothetical protein B0H14DRAFT_3907374 [Mycena olivaceomarginata]|nr:hypothetical protein B0H14DRAFT_3907374 [Mycena olivaceomarginata]
MSSVTLRRCAVIGKSNKTLYDGVLAQAEAHHKLQLANHTLSETFFPSKPDRRGNLYYEKADGTPFVASLVAEIASQEQGTYLSACPKSLPPPSKLPMTDDYVKSHRMVLALRCPSKAPAPLRKLFRNGTAKVDAIRGANEALEVSRGEKWNIIESIVCKEGEEDPADRIIVQARLHQTFEVPHDRDVPTTGRKRITIEEDITEPPTTNDVENTPGADPKIDDHFPVSVLPEISGPCFELEKAKLVQRDYKDMEGNLISPADLNSKLTEGTLVLVMLKFATYIMKNRTRSLFQVYHVLIDKLRILDHGDGEPFVASIPVAPETRFPTTPTKRARDDAADSAFDSFASNATPSPAKRAKRKP